VSAALALLVMAALPLAAANAFDGDETTAPSDESAAPADDLTFTVGMTGTVDSFNPFNGIVAESFEMWALMYDYMITYSAKDMQPEPGLAESWETSDDGLTWTFDIRTGVKWSDGQDLTAEDIAYTYSRIIDGGPEAAPWASYLSSVESAEAPDAETVVLTLKKPNAVLPLLPIPIVPKHIWEKIPEKAIASYPNAPKNGKSPVGSGAFRLIKGEADGRQYVFERNPDYWQGEPNMSRVVYRVYSAPDAMIQALIAGEIDFASGLDALQIKKLESESDITAHNCDSPGFDEIAFNVGAVDTKTGDPIGDGNPAVQDKAFRVALSFAVDRDQIITQAYQGAGLPGTTIIPPAYEPWRWTPDDEDAFAYDPEKAKEMLDAAGYTVGGDGFRTMPNGDPIGQLRLFARSDSNSSLQTMELMQQYLKDVDIDSKVISENSNKLTNTIIDGNFDLFQWGWYVEPDPDSMLGYLICDQLGVWNDAWWCNEEYDALYTQQHGEMDLEKRQEDVKQMQEVMYEDMPYIVTAYTTVGEAYRSDRWAGFTEQPDPGGVWLFQYGIANYLQIHPPVDAAASGGGGSDDPIDSAQVIGLGIAGIVIFIGGGLIGGFAGYRKASVDFRE
jgi:peptide/nickel transport system substrate-binding protein